MSLVCRIVITMGCDQLFGSLDTSRIPYSHGLTGRNRCDNRCGLLHKRKGRYFRRPHQDSWTVVEVDGPLVPFSTCFIRYRL
jgi:hypothetical protein